MKAELVTKKQASELLGISVRSIHLHVVAGRVSRVNTGGSLQGTVALYERREIEALRPYIKQYQREISLNKPEKFCPKCERTLPTNCFLVVSKACGKPRHHPKCRECAASILRNYRHQNQEMRNRYDREYHRNYDRLTAAITEGKTSPICRRHGFSVVVVAPGKYRAARLDKPLLPGERALTCYEFHNAEWGVYPPIILVAGSREMTDWCERYEMRQKQKAQGESR